MDASAALVPFDRLPALARRESKRYLEADPFPHIVLDNVLDPRVLHSVLKEFSGPYEIDWEKFWRASEVKLGTRDESQLAPVADASSRI
jgi:hypothetical protein